MFSTDELKSLWAEGAALWDRYERDRGFEAYVPADYPAIWSELQKLQGKVTTFLEWGSGLGILTIMASQLGFDAYGLEIAPELVAHAEDLATRYRSNAKFVVGSFVPSAYRWSPDFGEDGLRTDFDATDGYDELGMDLSDFDLVYAYPWPDEHGVFLDIMKHHAADRALFMTYDVREGISLKRIRTRER